MVTVNRQNLLVRQFGFPHLHATNHCAVSAPVCVVVFGGLPIKVTRVHAAFMSIAA